MCYSPKRRIQALNLFVRITAITQEVSKSLTARQTLRNTLVVLTTLAAAYILLISFRVLVTLFIAIIIASAIRPAIERMVRWGVPSSVGIIGSYIIIVSLIVLLAVVIFPPVMQQVIGYVEHDERLAERIIRAQKWIENQISDVTGNEVSLVEAEQIRDAVAEFIVQLGSVAPSMLDDLGNAIGDVILIFVMGAYWLTAHQKATDFVKNLFEVHQRDRVERIINEIENTMGGYVRGVMIIAVVVGFLNFIGYSLLNVPNALLLSFIVGTTTTIPIIGGLVGGVLVTALTLVASPSSTLTTAIVAFLVQQFESYYLAPNIMSDKVELNPLLVIVYTSIGFLLFGILGALIAVPVMGVVHVLLLHLIIEPRQEQVEPEYS